MLHHKGGTNNPHPERGPLDPKVGAAPLASMRGVSPAERRETLSQAAPKQQKAVGTRSHANRTCKSSISCTSSKLPSRPRDALPRELVLVEHSTRTDEEPLLRGFSCSNTFEGRLSHTCLSFASCRRRAWASLSASLPASGTITLFVLMVRK